jgi:hypothetical protein
MEVHSIFCSYLYYFPLKTETSLISIKAIPLFEKIQLGRLFLFLLAILMAGSLVFNSIKTVRYLKDKNVIQVSSEAIARTNRLGGNAILGRIISTSYSNQSTISIARDDKFYKKYRLLPVLLNLYAYPVAVKHDDFDCYLKKREFKLLLKNNDYLNKAIQFEDKIGRIKYYLIRNEDPALKLYAYKRNVILAPENLINAMIR